MLVSVIIPMFNSKKTIIRCLDSIISQSYENIEVIVVDDGSTDGSKEIVLDYQKTNKNIRYYYQENMGPAVARNVGIVYAKGEIISFVDSDDTLSSDAIEKMICSQKKFHSDLVIGNHARVNNGNYYPSNDELEDTLNVLDAVKYTMQGKIKVGCCGKLYKKEFIEKNELFFPSDRYGEDIYFLFKLYSCNPIITTITDDIYVVFNTENSICNSFNWKFIYQFDTLDMIKEILLKLKAWEILKNDYYRYYSHVLWFLIGYGCRFHNRKFIKEVKHRNMLPRKYIQIERNAGLRGFVGSLLFKLDLLIYCEVKMAVDKVKILMGCI